MLRRLLIPAALTATTLMVTCVPPASAALGDRMLRKGHTGKDVRQAQRALTKLGHRTTVDGHFGRRTARSVRRYEREHGMKVNARISRRQGRRMRERARAASGESAPATAGARAFPVQGSHRYGDGYGDRAGRHDGVDILARCGVPLVAAEAGTVRFSATHAAAGNYAVIRGRHSGEDHVYMHLRDAPPSKGRAFAAGERIGRVGRSGNASACHLHFEIWTEPGWYEGGRSRDPMPDLRAWSG